MLADSRARVVLTEERLRPLLPEGIPVLYVDALAAEIGGEGEERPARRGLAQNAACVVYTSGSTGQPKGVVLTQRGLVNLVVSFIRSYSPGIEDRMLPLTSVASASFVGEVLPILCADGGLVLPDREEILDTARLVELIAGAEVSILSTVPSLIATLNAMKDELPRLRLILCGGEALAAGDVDRILESATIVNGYGLTETTVCSTVYTLSLADVQSGGTLPIGRPLMNHRLYILDPELNLMPIGCVGKLYIAGDGLARGYLGNPAQTADRFVPDPFASGERMYRTGDLAGWLPDGNIVYRGRIDQQVKVRGFRIELGEIESVLSLHPGLAEVAVVARRETPGERRLVAYVVAKEAPPAVEELLAWLRERLPEYMVPSAFVFLASLPLSPNGKVDMRSLPAPDRLRPELAAAYTAPKSELERIIAAVWQEALAVEKVGIHDNFFDLGGHSLLLAKVHARLREVLERDLSLVDLFKNPHRLLPRRGPQPPAAAAGRAPGGAAAGDAGAARRAPAGWHAGGPRRHRHERPVPGRALGRRAVGEPARRPRGHPLLLGSGAAGGGGRSRAGGQSRLRQGQGGARRGGPLRRRPLRPGAARGGADGPAAPPVPGVLLGGAGAGRLQLRPAALPRRGVRRREHEHLPDHQPPLAPRAGRLGGHPAGVARQRQGSADLARLLTS